MKKSDYSLAKRIKSAEQLMYRQAGGALSAGIIVPNPYSVGVVGLSSHILIKLAVQNDASVERFYADSAGTGLRGWTSGRQASEMDILLCSVSYEPDLLLLARMLRQGGISPLAGERRPDDPIVAVGGVAVLGAPQLAAQIGDLVAWGEAETIVPALLAESESHKGENRSAILKHLVNLDGIKAGSQEIATNVPWRYYRSFKDNPGHSVIITPYSEFGVSYLVELARGCPHGCKHCFACRAQSPFRYASPKVIEELMEASGSKKVGLVGLGVASHPQLLPILESLLKMDKSLATASLTAEDLSAECMQLIAKMGQRTLTLSPEAGNEELRQSIGKMAEESKWVKIANEAWDAGFKTLRLYFMVGLPNENEDDLAAIGRLVRSISSEFHGKIAVTVAPFVPKPHTAWQHQIPPGEREWSRQLKIVRAGLTGVTVRVESPRQAMLQWRLSQLTSLEARSFIIDQIS
jgi:radical SAM superfamily enzyme YgiQ (UPF0313 family)